MDDKRKVSEFVEDLPLDLKTPLSISIYEDLHSKIDLLKGKKQEFIAWICPLLQSQIHCVDEMIYYKGDVLTKIFFLKTGTCNYVLPMYGSTPYITVVDHTCFGLIDIIAQLLENEEKGIMSMLNSDE
jgi:hypothetical protein